MTIALAGPAGHLVCALSRALLPQSRFLFISIAGASRALFQKGPGLQIKKVSIKRRGASFLAHTGLIPYDIFMFLHFPSQVHIIVLNTCCIISLVIGVPIESCRVINAKISPNMRWNEGRPMGAEGLSSHKLLWLLTRYLSTYRHLSCLNYQTITTVVHPRNPHRPPVASAALFIAATVVAFKWRRGHFVHRPGRWGVYFGDVVAPEGFEIFGSQLLPWTLEKSQDCGISTNFRKEEMAEATHPHWQSIMVGHLMKSS